jgi:hypothetical protein
MFQVIPSSTTVVPNATTVGYIHPWSTEGAPWIGNQTLPRTQWTVEYGNIKISNLTVQVDVAPGAAASGKKWEFELWKNNASTGLIVTILETGTISYNSTVVVSGTSTDYFQLKCTPTGTPTTPTLTQWSFVMETDGDYYMWAGASNNGTSTTLTSYPYPWGFNNTTVSTTEATGRNTIAHSCKVIGFFARVTAAPGVGKSRLYSLYVNGVEDVTTRANIADGATSAGNSGLSVSLSQNDYINVTTVPTGTPAATDSRTVIVFRPTNAGESTLPSSPQSMSNSATIYWGVVRSYTSTSATEAPVLGIVPVNTQFWLKNYSVTLVTNPGAGGSGKKRDFRWRKNSGNASNLITISETATVGNDNASIDSFSYGDTFSIQEIPTSLPTSSGGRAACVMFMPTFTPSVSII